MADNTNADVTRSPGRVSLTQSRSVGYLAEPGERDHGVHQAASAGDMPSMVPVEQDNGDVFDQSHPSSDPGMMASSSQTAIIRSSNWRNRLMSQTFNFFGVGDNCQTDQQRWRMKSTRHMSRRHGGVKPEFERGLEQGETGIPQIIDPLARPRSRDELDGPRGPLPSQLSTATGTSSILQKQYSNKIIRQRSKRQSVAKMGWEAIRQSVRHNRSSFLRSSQTVTSQSRRPPLVHSRSFAPASLMAENCEDYDDIDSSHFFSPGAVSEDIQDDVFFDFSPPTRRRELNQTKTLPRIDSVTSDQESAAASSAVAYRPDGLRESISLPGFVGRRVRSIPDEEEEEGKKIKTKKKKKKKKEEEDEQEEDDAESGLSSPHVAFSDATPLTDPGEPPPTDFFDYGHTSTPAYGLDNQMTPRMADMVPTGIGWRKKAPDDRFNLSPIFPQDIPDSGAGRQIIRRNKIHDKIMQHAMDNSDRREIGKGLVGRVLNRSFRSKRMDSYVQKQIEEIEDHRPYFTYWVTTVQVIIMIVSLAFYGFAPIGFNYTQKTGLVQQTNLVVETVGYMEPDNFWIGPRPADLVHLGAKYAPCMHRDEEIYYQIKRERHLESQSGCCIRTDGAGCLQTLEEECSTIFATFHKWPDPADSSHSRLSGPVCGQDPRECLNPLSTPPYEWPDNISNWEICKEHTDTPKYPHTTCTLTGRPCCIGIQGECHIVSRQYCDFVNGYFHEEATLCSQVDCLDDICGLLNFVNTDYPDQFYRLWLSIFMHAGIFHCILTIIMQMTILRDLEKLAGWFRISVIYIFSGIGGNLTSAIFIPFRAEVGPAGAQFGLLACLIVEVLQSWQMLKSPLKAIGKLLCIIGFLFVLGLLPWIDNFAHLGGFICGILLSFIFLPYICFGEFDKRRKRIQIFVCSILLVAYYILAIVLFYITPVRDCPWCQYFNCIPITEDFCNDMELRLEDRSTL
ncbi:inactive rhomboid protein 1-like isoform X2 [Apostichopus japonicus]|uniref:inactive rhomboid protein 1-like isoform X2 n=1 Tax=Stichopus japonicus TaxID=307972 RepID=UPI003AB49228